MRALGLTVMEKTVLCKDCQGWVTENMGATSSCSLNDKWPEWIQIMQKTLGEVTVLSRWDEGQPPSFLPGYTHPEHSLSSWALHSQELKFLPKPELFSSPVISPTQGTSNIQPHEPPSLNTSQDTSLLQLLPILAVKGGEIRNHPTHLLNAAVM